MDTLTELAAAAVSSLRDGGRTAGVAESLTSGQLAWLLGCAPGSGDVFAGGVVTYSREAKARMLDVDPDRVVDPATALEMARRAQKLFDVDVCVSLTGVAGPESQDGMPVGTVYVGWAGGGDSGVDECRFDGDPDVVRSGACGHALRRIRMLAEA